MPVQLSITVQDGQVKSVIKNVGLAVQTVPPAALKMFVGEAKNEYVGDYPNGSPMGYNVPTRPNQTYIRTGDYGEKTKVVSRANNQYKAGYSIINTSSHAAVVGGRADGSGQAMIHKGRWKKLRDVMEKVIDKAVAWAAAEFNRVLGRGAGGF